MALEVELGVDRVATDERLREETEPADDQCRTDELAHRRLRAFGERARDLHADERQRRRADQHPHRERHVHVAELAVTNRAERLEDRTVEDVRADRRLRIEAEEQDQHRRHQRAAAHAGHADEHADQQAREAELPGHARGGSGQETNGRPRSRQPSLYASQPVQKPVIAASSARAATRMPEPGSEHREAGDVRDRRGRQHDEPDDVRRARRARVLERSFAEARLDHLEVEDAGQAVAPPEHEPDGEL